MLELGKTFMYLGNEYKIITIDDEAIALKLQVYHRNHSYSRNW